MIYLFSIQPWTYKGMDLPESLNYADYDSLYWRGDSKIAGWKPMPVEWVIESPEDEKSPIPDMGSFGGGRPFVSPRAYEVLKDILKGYVEFLPVNHLNEEGAWYLLNVTHVIDVLIKEKSKYRIYDSGRIGACQHGYIDMNKAEDSLIFMVDGYLSTIFINDEMKRILEDNHLTGPLIREYLNPE